ncbi:MAG TPA: SUMF1/EgtB/PvdO family nonheme iron enzyme [Vicinamibacterales bacterium]|nr:SUMF1/EgtB/PvdO family nonheme iron enzyme [Vicinamibacterales bacterium]
MTFVEIPAGWFLMGSDAGQDDERPVHRVFVDAFAMAACPVTRAEYAAFLADTRHDAPREWTSPAFAAPDLPVVGVSWDDARRFCAWSAARGEAIALPTEAQWERAARGGTEGAAYPWGDAIPSWMPEGGRGPLPGPWPAGLGEPNAYGLYGIAANVHEWCLDWHDRDYYARSPSHNPPGADAGSRRASRGGSWRHAVTISRCAARSKIDPAYRYTDYGFRVVRADLGASAS